MMLICASPSISRMKRTHRVHRMQRWRFSISVGPKSTSPLTPSPSNDAPREFHAALVRAERVREILQRTFAALVAHRAVERVVDEQELEHARARASTTSGVRVLTTMPSVQMVEHEVCSFGIFSIFTMQTRHEPSMPIPG